MKNLLLQSLFCIITPSLIFPQDQLLKVEEQAAPTKTESHHTYSYDEIINLIDEIESGELEEKCNLADLERINQFLVFLATEGMLPESTEENFSLDEDVDELLNGEMNPYIYCCDLGNNEYMVVPMIFSEYGEIVLCKSWVKKKWNQTKKFVKKHKKAIIIGAVVIVAAAVIVVAVVAASSTAAGTITAANVAKAATAAGVAGATGALASENLNKNENPSVAKDPISIMETTNETSQLKSAVDEQIYMFKENIVNEQFFKPFNPASQLELSLEENGRALGSLFAHESLKNLEEQISKQPKLSQEIQEIGSKFSMEKSNSTGHMEIDKTFATDYSYFYVNPEERNDFCKLSYQTRGEKALEYGYYQQAIHDFEKAIEMNPLSPDVYLDRGVAYFRLGQYEQSLEDFHAFSEQAKMSKESHIPNFSLSFAKALPKGIYDSAEGMFSFVSDLVTHPVHTSQQMWNALTVLSELAQQQQWGVLSEALAPEVHQLVKEWDMLSLDKRGELAGYAFGKYGSDILIPAALAKLVSKGLKGAQELNGAYKSLQTAEQTLILESLVGLENGSNIAEVIQTKTTMIAEQLGFSSHEIDLLKNNVKNVPHIPQDINFSKHALSRAVERGISREAILETLGEPLKIEGVKIDNFGRPSQRFIGKKAEVVINPETQQVVSVNPTSTRKFEKLNNELLNVKN